MSARSESKNSSLLSEKYGLCVYIKIQQSMLHRKRKNSRISMVCLIYRQVYKSFILLEYLRQLTVVSLSQYQQIPVLCVWCSLICLCSRETVRRPLFCTYTTLRKHHFPVCFTLLACSTIPPLVFQIDTIHWYVRKQEE